MKLTNLPKDVQAEILKNGEEGKLITGRDMKHFVEFSDLHGRWRIDSQPMIDVHPLGWEKVELN